MMTAPLTLDLGSPFTHSSLSLCIPISQSLVEAAEEADLKHEFNASLVVSADPELVLEGFDENTPSTYSGQP